MEADAETIARERSRTVWDAMAAGWEGRRDQIWADSGSVGEWLVQKLAPQRRAAADALAWHGDHDEAETDAA